MGKKFNVSKVEALPDEPLKDHVYFVKRPGMDTFQLKATTGSGEVVNLDGTRRIHEERIGDGATTEFIINHNLDCDYIYVETFEVEPHLGPNATTTLPNGKNQTLLIYEYPPAVGQKFIRCSTCFY